MKAYIMCRICCIKYLLSTRYRSSATYRGWAHIAENGLSRQRVSIWIYEGELSIEYQQTLLARYRCEFDSKHRQLQDVNAPTFYDTPFGSPQLELIELDDEQWIKFQRRPTRHYSRRMAMLPQQLSLIDLGASALVLLALKAI